MKSEILTLEVYEARVMARLVNLGMDADRARELASGRFPMSAADVLGELRARGLVLTDADLGDFLRARFDRTHFDDGEPIRGDAIGWNRRIVAELVNWATANHRGTATADAPRAVVTVADLFTGLRDPSPDVRFGAGVMLSRSIGAGLAVTQEHAEDVEYIIGPQVATLVSRAVQGDSTAVDELERIVTHEHPAHRAERIRQAEKRN